MRGEKTSMNARLEELTMRAVWAAGFVRFHDHVAMARTKTEAGTSREMSPSQTGALLAKSDRFISWVARKDSNQLSFGNSSRPTRRKAPNVAAPVEAEMR